MIGRVAVVGIAGVIALAACSNSSPASHDPTTSALSASPASPGAQGFGGPRGPAASGTVAAISGTTMQVQNPQSGQVAVMWTSSTKFTHQIATTLAAVKAGDCVTAVAPSGTSFDATAFTASSLVVSTGACTVVAGPGRSGVPSGFPSGSRPSGFPSGSRPSGFPSGRPRVGAIATGKVTSIAGNTLVIAARQFRDSGTSNKTVTVTSSTKITTEAATTATSVKVGKCVTAEGKADSTGAVSATQVRITDPVNGQCDTFGRFGGGGG
jgi:hypothetical protein